MDVKEGMSIGDAISRVRMMASGDPKWDLSPNDIASLKLVLMLAGEKDV